MQLDLVFCSHRLSVDLASCSVAPINAEKNIILFIGDLNVPVVWPTNICFY